MCLAIPGQIVELLPDTPSLAVVSVIGVRRRIHLGLLAEPAAPGDWVLIHVGFAMSKISEADARDQLEMLARLGEGDAALEEVTGYDLGGRDRNEESSG